MTNTPAAHYALYTLQALCAAGVAVALWLMPGAPRLLTWLALFAMAAMASIVYRRSGAYCLAGEGVIATTVTLLGILLIANVHSYCQAGGTDMYPVLNNHDLSRNYNDALSLLGYGGQAAPVEHGYYASIAAALMWVTGGPSITVASLLSLACLTATLLLTAGTVWRLTADRRVAVTAMVCVVMICQLAALATVFIKDCWVIMTMALAAYGLVQWRRSIPWLVALAIVMMAPVRTNYVFAIAAGVVVFSCFTSDFRRKWLWTASLLLLCIVAWAAVHYTGHSPRIAIVTAGAPDLDQYRTASQQAYYDIVGNDLNASPLRKIVNIPAAAVTQFLIPLPWTCMRDAVFGPSFVVAHFGYTWYFFAAVFVYYFFVWRRVAAGPAARAVMLLALWGLLCWLLPCYLAMGTVSRYALSAIPLTAPAVALTLQRCRRRSLAIWLCVFAVAMAMVLNVVMNMQQAAMA